MEYLLYLKVFLLCFSLILSVVLVVGWLTCADYWFKACSLDYGLSVGVQLGASGMMAVLMTGGLLTKSTDFINDMLNVNALYVTTIFLLFVIFNIAASISNIRRYFAAKRGRTL